jgi:hypothetical protein
MEVRLALIVVVLLASASARAGNVVNVKNYGAKGNGVNDDTKVGAAPSSSSC